MGEPVQWSLPIGRLFGAVVRLHISLPIVMLGLYLKAVLRDFPQVEGIAVAAAAVAALQFISILMHEFGHVFAARAVGGDSDEVLMWPLGGLAMCSLPQQPRAHLLTAIGGPMVTFSICMISAAFLVGQGYWPPLNPFTTNPYFPALTPWAPTEAGESTWILLLASRVFYFNWFLLLFNLLPAFPLDGGQVLHAILWSRSDEREATGTTAYVSFGILLILAVVALWFDSVLLFALVVFLYVTCRQKLVEAEYGGEDVGYGFDPGGGFAAGEREALPARRKPRVGFIQRWRQRRAAERALREQQEREGEELRMEELLKKVHDHGLHSLTDDERRFMSKVSNRYRNNKS